MVEAGLENAVDAEIDSAGDEATAVAAVVEIGTETLAASEAGMARTVAEDGPCASSVASDRGETGRDSTAPAMTVNELVASETQHGTAALTVAEAECETVAALRDALPAVLSCPEICVTGVLTRSKYSVRTQRKAEAAPCEGQLHVAEFEEWSDAA